MTDSFDYSGDQQTPGDNLLTQLRGLADTQEGLEEEIEELKAQLEAKEAELKVVSEQQIPNLLDGLGGRINLKDGRTVIINEVLEARLTKDQQPEAYAWMREIGHGNLIKSTFTFEFQRDQDEAIKAFEKFVQTYKAPLNKKRKDGVHWSTLQSWVREMAEQDDEFPLEKFNARVNKSAKIKRK